jgi:hypothetical protein
MQRFFSGASQNRDRTKGGVWYGPGSAAHHAPEEAARALRPGHQTSQQSEKNRAILL